MKIAYGVYELDNKQALVEKAGWGYGYIFIPRSFFDFQQNLHWLDMWEAPAVLCKTSPDGEECTLFGSIFTKVFLDKIEWLSENKIDNEHDYYVWGFDTRHIWNNPVDHDKDFVITETKIWAENVQNYINTLLNDENNQ